MPSLLQTIALGWQFSMMLLKLTFTGVLVLLTANVRRRSTHMHSACPCDAKKQHTLLPQGEKAKLASTEANEEFKLHVPMYDLFVRRQPNGALRRSLAVS